ncbi:helix-turn-helix transcriptional regulator [Brevundimonas sp. TWP2-3-4b1]|uniref:helix-turn-helix transcriptional regulator n=1 Tax=Brevundimonas sp. TWP2-3-4b1 TaxID=2804580 RepID=UPI003CF98F18
MTPNKHLTARQLMARYCVCRRTIGRWTNQPGLNFPKPVEINRRRYWREDDIEQWEQGRRGERS